MKTIKVILGVLCSTAILVYVCLGLDADCVRLRDAINSETVLLIGHLRIVELLRLLLRTVCSSSGIGAKLGGSNSLPLEAVVTG